MKRPKLVEVHWLDHSGPWPAGSTPRLIKRHTTGYLVKDGPSTVTIAGTWDGKRHFDDMTVIGKSMVTRTRKL